ncbi:UDP-N-acetylmuramoyl-L-alanine--D-glutamate ligase [Methylococcaceae bacterium CS1]|nr:UDP-N-acetylmuramoyl-L-alanine--D-glutamate ligase [Methyloprofundus sp.]TXK96153.1 UDP-N-acetylmuramoyl-L-alanine--D-glutamate ligase [Methylococcaceae bacterium CS4]TXK97765.1 UDP-N-acetylmuramoyl-L-alanine--D-glutamate ligase [Methylococcaceae bacterium CS5]TXL05795.1 UDP-N-acetylmuramoyl-L-alanine--D-glutamate ligase [Methylococcaceae bacterium CS1]TXL08145.1 UDP-N-acetylmuramoyl-L-alanine--D-glutamate ligase [Methylococcaceae bacterium CS3]TXL10280.1 UDP-N-acetylmuramoyl-L-alanine--D-g
MNNDDILIALNKQFSLNKESSKVVVVGLGLTGLSVAYFLDSLGLQFAIVDSRKKPPFNDELLAKVPDVAVFTDGFDQAVFDVASHIIVSPGVSMDEPMIQQAIANGVRPLSDIDLFACSVSEQVVAITGSNGKSTVTTLLGDMAIAAGKRVAVGGNLGTPALNLLNKDAELYVLELSSFQLERTSQLTAVAATVLNISEDHLDRYANLDAYIAQKNKVYAGNGVMLVNLDCPYATKVQQTNRNVLTFGFKEKADYSVVETAEGKSLAFHERAIFPVNELLINGVHNQANAMAALALGSTIGLPEQVMCDVLRIYKGLEHRVQFVANINGVSWINDSKATNVGACVAALKGYKDSTVVLIAGGDAKAADMSDLVPLLKEKVKTLLLIGKDSQRIEQAVNGCIPVFDVGTLKKAVQKASKIAQPGDTVLLSPACASLDQFANYKDRGEQFVTEVKGLKQ